MNYSKTPPTKPGYYRVRRESTKSYHAVALLENLRFYFADGSAEGCDEKQMAILDYEFGPEVLFSDEPQSMYAPTAEFFTNIHERELFERCFLAAMTGDWATDELMGNCNDQWYEERARIYRRAAQAAVKVLAEAKE